MNILKLFFLIQFFLNVSYLRAQKIDTVYTEKNGELETFYLAMIPGQLSKGLLVILGGFTFPTEITKETDLPAKAWKEGYTILMPYLFRPDSVDKHNIFQSRLEQLIPQVIQKYSIPKNKFIIGGHSWAGHQAFIYAENTFKQENKNSIKPNAVFGVDPPMDLKRLYDGYQRAIDLNIHKSRGGEAEMIISLFNRQFGGSTKQKPKNYEKSSSYYRDAKDGGNIKYLKSVPVRLYADPDVNWHIDERNNPIEWTNLSDITASIVQLKILGNKNAEFINCLGKGFQQGKRHPHGFSMLDSDEFIKWANKVLNNEVNF